MFYPYNLCFLDVPGPPVNFTFEEIRNTSLICKWDPPKDDGGSEVLNYILEKKDNTKDDGGWITVTSTCKGCKYPVTKLIEGKEYIFRISAENKFGPGLACYSSPVIAKNQFGKIFQMCLITFVLDSFIFLSLKMSYGFQIPLMHPICHEWEKLLKTICL